MSAPCAAMYPFQETHNACADASLPSTPPTRAAPLFTYDAYSTRRPRPAPTFYLGSLDISPALLPLREEDRFEPTSSTSLFTMAYTASEHGSDNDEADSGWYRAYEPHGTDGSVRRLVRRTTSEVALVGASLSMGAYRLGELQHGNVLLSPFEESRSTSTSIQRRAPFSTPARQRPPMPVEYSTRRGTKYEEAIADIHRVLYRGQAGPDGMGPRWRVQGPQIRKVINTRLDPSCGYDHPFLRLSHRDAFFTHFALINLVASPSIPTGRPESGYYLMTITTRLLRGVIGLTNKGARDIEAAQSALDQEERASEPNAASDEDFELEEKMDRPECWWRPWDVTSRYVSVGGADEASGEHFVMMDQVVTFTLFPSFITPYRALQRDLEAGQVAATMCSKALGSKSFVHKCAGLIEAELSCSLHWELPISTMVRFNDQGKAIHIRDTVTFSNVVDSFVPFAKRTRAISRRVIGTVLAELGRLVVAFIPAGPPKPPSATTSAASSPAAVSSGTSLLSPSPLVLGESLHSEVQDEKSASSPTHAAQYPLPETGDSAVDLMGDSVRREDVVSQDSSPTVGSMDLGVATDSQLALEKEERQ